MLKFKSEALGEWLRTYFNFTVQGVGMSQMFMVNY
jgi:hypothetical protein